jgi:pseudouridine synthase
LAAIKPLSRVAGPQPIARVLLAAGHVHAQALLAQRRVTSDGRTLSDAGARVDPWRRTITVDGTPIVVTHVCRYLMLHKPYRVLSEWADPEGRGRKTLSDLVPLEGLEPAGRLDYESEGLLLLTDDGWLLHRLTHPHYEHPKVYWVLVEGAPDDAALEALRQGVPVKGEVTREAEVSLLPADERPDEARVHAPEPMTWLRVVLRQGRKHQVRHMTAAVGHPTLRLMRVALGPLTLGALKPGDWRTLKDEELAELSRMLKGSDERRR